MAIDPCLKSLLSQTINIRRVTDFGDGGDETLAAAVSALAYVEDVRSRDGGPGTGTQLGSGHLIITETKVTMDDRIYLPALDALGVEYSRKPKNVSVCFLAESTVVSHYEVTL